MKRKASYTLLLLTCITGLLAACQTGNQPVPLSCDSSNTLFNQVYNDVLQSPNAFEDTTMDLHVHTYTFNVSAPATICKIGYRSMPSMAGVPYGIEIYNNTTGTLVYSGSHIFSATGTSYVAITPTALTPGDSYTIKRVQAPQTSLNDILSRMAADIHDTLHLPATQGILTITGSSFYNRPGGPDTGLAYKHCLPYIDIVFE